MVYTDRMLPVFQIDGTFFAIGPTILVEWEE